MLPPKKKVVIFSFPKSSTKYIRQIICGTLNWKFTVLFEKPGRKEQDLFLPKLIDYHRKNVVVAQHTSGTKFNVDLVIKYKIKPVVMVRNIFDVIVSLRDWTHDKEHYYLPMGYLEKSFYDFDDEKQFDVLIANIVPWYFGFYVSWQMASQNCAVLWVTYERFMKDKAATVLDVLEHSDINVDRRRIDETIAALEKRPKHDINLNKGISGRGEKILTQRQQAKIAEFAGYYPGVDFSKMGL
jgi:hypothetical protein